MGGGADERQVTRCIAFVDLAGFTALAEAHGDERAARTARRLVEMTELALRPGTELVKSLGDAVMLAADSAQPVIDSIEAMTGRWRSEPGALLLRGGIHL